MFSFMIGINPINQIVYEKKDYDIHHLKQLHAFAVCLTEKLIIPANKISILYRSASNNWNANLVCNDLKVIGLFISTLQVYL